MSSGVGQIKKRQKLSEAQKWSVVAYSNFFRDVDTKRFDYRTQSGVLDMFNISKKTLQYTLREYDEKFAESPFSIDLAPQYIGHVGVASSLTDEVTENVIDIHNLCLMEEDGVTDQTFTDIYNENFDTNFSTSTMQRYMNQLGLKVKSM